MQQEKGVSEFGSLPSVTSGFIVFCPSYKVTHYAHGWEADHTTESFLFHIDIISANLNN
jgi:hypothetical protein